MAELQTLEKPKDAGVDVFDDIWHYICECSPGYGMCGVEDDTELEDFSPPDENVCPLCALIYDKPCKKCGE